MPKTSVYKGRPTNEHRPLRVMLNASPQRSANQSTVYNIKPHWFTSLSTLFSPYTTWRLCTLGICLQSLSTSPDIALTDHQEHWINGFVVFFFFLGFVRILISMWRSFFFDFGIFLSMETSRLPSRLKTWMVLAPKGCIRQWWHSNHTSGEIVER